MVAAVEGYCAKNDYNLILTNTNGDSQRLQSSLQMLIQKQVDGLLLMSTETHLAEQLSLELSIPAVVMDWWPNGIKCGQNLRRF